MEHRAETGWCRAGEAFEIEWSAEPWTLDHADGRIGLRRRSGGGLYLALAAVAATGRSEDGVFTVEALVGFEIVHSRLLATFEPRGWHGLSIRAAWGLCRAGRGMDLEVQASATSVGQLKRLEILVESRPMGGSPEDGGLTAVSPRDRLAAAASYDGREPAGVLRRLATEAVPKPGRSEPPPPTPVSTWDARETGTLGGYIEMGRAEDVARHIRESSDRGGVRSARYALFGHDLEKGVVLRGRLRGVHVSAPVLSGTPGVVGEEVAPFLTEPLPLRTS